MIFLKYSAYITFSSEKDQKKDQAERWGDRCLFLTRLLMNAKETNPGDENIEPLSKRSWYLLCQIGLCAGHIVIFPLCIMGIICRYQSTTYKQKMGNKMVSLAEFFKQDPRYYRRAFSLYKQAASLGNTQALYELAFCHYTGLVTPKDVKKAFHLYQEAAKRGMHEAMWFVAFFYEHGIGVKEEESKAVEWYEKAGEQENSAAINFLIDYYKDNPDRLRYWTDKLPAKVGV